MCSPPITTVFEGFTQLRRVPLVPEIEMHLATGLTPLWEATQELLGETDVPPPFWAFAWPGGQAIARHVLDHPELVHGRRVLDLGCGGGLQAIAAAQARAVEVTANDVDPLALMATRLNAAANGVDPTLLADDLVGTAEPGGLRWDVVLAGDVCYERGMAGAVLAWLRGQVDRGAVVILGDPGRAYAPSRQLDELATYDVPVDTAVEDADHKRTHVWRLRRGGTR
jgi:predicted nicotinamide N-methyase